MLTENRIKETVFKLCCMFCGALIIPALKRLTVGSLPGGPHTLEDASFPHGVEIFDRVVLLVEVSIGLFPGLWHCVLWRTDDNQDLQKQRLSNRENVKMKFPFLIFPDRRDLCVSLKEGIISFFCISSDSTSTAGQRIRLWWLHIKTNSYMCVNTKAGYQVVSELLQSDDTCIRSFLYPNLAQN